MLTLLVIAALLPDPVVDTANELGTLFGAIAAIATVIGLIIALGRVVIAGPVIKKSDKRFDQIESRIQRVEDKVELAVQFFVKDHHDS